jgi:protein arginine kinase
VAFGETETLSVMVNEEDHLRLQGMAAGLDLDRAWSRVSELDRSLEDQVEFATSERLGYLTGCPTNVGTGMRASVMLHLPALGLVRTELEKVFTAAQRTGLAVRGMYGEGSRAAGDFYQISNQVTLGRSEQQLVDDLKALVPSIADYERKVRGVLLEEQRAAIQDKVSRAYGILRTARSMETEHALSHLSLVRLGECLGLLDTGAGRDLKLVAIQIQKGHLQALHGDATQHELLDVAERDRLRASYLRRRFADRSN